MSHMVPLNKEYCRRENCRSKGHVPSPISHLVLTICKQSQTCFYHLVSHSLSFLAKYLSHNSSSQGYRRLSCRYYTDQNIDMYAFIDSLRISTSTQYVTFTIPAQGFFLSSRLNEIDFGIYTRADYSTTALPEPNGTKPAIIDLTHRSTSISYSL
jgi:hypothetical protein